MTTCLDLGGIMLSEISQTEKYDFTYMWNLKTNNKKQNQSKHRDTQNILIVPRNEGCRGQWVEKEKGLRCTNCQL